VSEYLDGDPDEDFDELDIMIVRLGRLPDEPAVINAYLPGDKEELSETQQRIEHVTSA
jgi:hypothetical protein